MLADAKREVFGIDDGDMGLFASYCYLLSNDVDYRRFQHFPVPGESEETTNLGIYVCVMFKNLLIKGVIALEKKMLEIKNREEKEVKSPVVTKYKGRY